jgi:hypothetical protein
MYRLRRFDMAMSPQDHFAEVAETARKHFASPSATEESFAQAEDYDLLHTGGGVMVAAWMLDNSHVIAVTAEITCLYQVEPQEDATAESLFQAAEDPWLVAGNES